MGNQLSSMIKSVYQWNNNVGKKVYNCIKVNITNKEMKISEQLAQKPDDNSVVVILDTESFKTSVSLDELTEKFAYFENKSDLKYFNKNKNVFTLSNLSKDSFKTLLQLTIKGEFKKFFCILSNCLLLILKNLLCCCNYTTLKIIL